MTGHRDRLARSEVLPPSHPWWGIDGYPDATALRGFRTLMLETVLRPEPDMPGRRLQGDRLAAGRGCAELLGFIRAVFPGARFVLNTRDLAHVAHEQVVGPQPRRAGRAAGDGAAVRRGAGRAGRGRVVPRALRRLGRRPDACCAACSTGSARDFDEERVRAVMDVPHSY